jgi:hypothetical protein
VRKTRTVGFVVVLILRTGAIGPLGAAGPVQTCIGPASSSQSGRASFTPGVSDLKAAQRIGLRVNLFHCTPANTDRGSATLNDTITPKGPQTCKLFTVPTVWKSTATLTWKNRKVSTIPLTYSLTGASQLVNIKGKVSSGLFAGHAVTAQLRYTEVVSPTGKYSHGSGIAQACVNRVPPNKYGRIVIASIDFYTTRHFTIG